MIETHPFGDFVPTNAKYLILGSFTAKKKDGDDFYDWFYVTKRSQFWPILEVVYNIKLDDKKAKQKLFTDLKIAITDIIYQCERKDDNSLDSNLINFVYNTEAIQKLLKENKIEKIFFSSRFVEKEFKKHFKNLVDEFSNIELITLPSPSPRYATMSVKEKIVRYSEIFPSIELLI
ncbi:MAG: hypothetical protein Q8L28_00175 [bacterium]|nr:hypothetical protein [bacterium]